MPKKTYQSPITPEEEALPLAVLQTHWKKIFFIAAAVVLLIWMVAVFGDSLIGRSKHWVTEQAKYVEKPVVLHADVIFIREESLLPGNTSGVLVMQVESGMRVGANQPYALVCQNQSDAELLAQQRVLEQRLRWLQDAEEAKTYHALNADELGLEVAECFGEFLKALDSGKCADLPERQEVFLHRATTLEAALGRPVAFAGEIADTKKELNSLRAQVDPAKLTQLEAAGSGDYYPAVDGLEQALTPQALQNINTVEALDKLRATPAKAVTNTTGKLVTGLRWYMAAELKAGKAQQMQEGQTYKVMFPQESARTFNMRAEKIRRSGDDAVVVLSCNEKDETMQCLRSAKAEIILDEVEGLEIPAAALRFLEKGTGQQKRPYTAVYIVRAAQLLQREVEVLYQDSEIAVVAWGRKNEAMAAEGDRITITGKLQSVTQPSDNKLLLIGSNLLLTGENLNVKPVLPNGPTTAVVAKRKLFPETILTGKNLFFEQSGESLIITGEDIAYREQRGSGLKIHDTVLVGGKVEDVS